MLVASTRYYILQNYSSTNESTSPFFSCGALGILQIKSNEKWKRKSPFTKQNQFSPLFGRNSSRLSRGPYIISVSNVCEAALISSFLALNRLNELPECISDFLSSWLVNRQCLFQQANHGAYSNPGTQMGLLCCFADGLNQSLVLFVVQARFFVFVIFMTDLKSSTFSGVMGTELKPVLLLNSFNTSTSLLRIWRKIVKVHLKYRTPMAVKTLFIQ